MMGSDSMGFAGFKGRKVRGGGAGFGGFGGGAMSKGDPDGRGIGSQIMDGVDQVEPVSTQVACECNHGLMVEAMKKFMFVKK
jgi:hypothetical protein